MSVSSLRTPCLFNESGGCNAPKGSIFIAPKATALLLEGIADSFNPLKPLVIMSIKPGPKPKKEDGTPDKRRRVTEENQPKHPGLKPHKHKKGE
ncbi:hypothetical protein [Hymenobacter sp. IS2118]|uniref:hypothetical protein n=1 Tax=Hymenobacter sp. IS2118 TaxID=1505605 RepID=UPI001267CF03|nr:hypothetical protein [Hymenobacter sp. IS2118]